MKFVIQGGKKLEGEITISGAKNGAFPLIAAAVLTGQDVTLHNIPEITDIRNILELVRGLGVVTDFQNHTVKLHAGQLDHSELDREIAKRMRASILLTAPILARLGNVSFPHPGGCVIGERPIDLFIDGYERMGATLEKVSDTFSVSIGRPRAIEFVFPTVSTTTTMCLMILASVANGTSKLINAALEPEIVMLADFLNKSGAKISGAGTAFITIEGIEKYPDKKLEFTNIPDRVETGSFLFLAASTKSHLTLTNTAPQHQDVVLDTLERIGVSVHVSGDQIEVRPASTLRPINIKTHEYPGFATDLQSPLIVALTQAKGMSIVQETIFEGRLFWLEDLKHMGARVMILDTSRASIEGPSQLKGKELRSPDLRAGMAYIIAGLAAQDGTTTIYDVEIIDRGYERIEERLTMVGADIKRV